MPVTGHQSPAGVRSNVRVPKLAVRNRSDNSIPLSEEVSPATSVISVASQLSPLHHHGDRRDSGQSVETTQPSRPSRKHQKPSKKDGGIFSFLTLKEPSTSAWEEYAKQQKQQAATGKAGVSMQKLPDHVPKVNSKWDGLPDVTKKNAARPSQSSRRRQSSARRSVSDSANIPSKPGSSSTNKTLAAATQDSKQGSVKSTTTSVLDDVDAILPVAQRVFDQGLIPVQSTFSPADSSIRIDDVDAILPVPQRVFDQDLIPVQSTLSPTNRIDTVTIQASPPPPRLLPSPADILNSPPSSPPTTALPALPSIVHELDSTEIHQLEVGDFGSTIPTTLEALPQTPPTQQPSTPTPTVESTLDQLGASWLTDSLVETSPTTPIKPKTSKTPLDSPTKPRVMNFSRPSRPLIETDRANMVSPSPQDGPSSPPNFSPPHTTRTISQPDGPVELPCPSTLASIPETPLPRPRAKNGFEGIKIGRFSTMLGLR